MNQEEKKEPEIAIICPGEAFTVSDGGKGSVEVVALAGSRQEALSELVQKMVEAEAAGDGVALFPLAKEALRISVGDDVRAAELWDTRIDAAAAFKIAVATLSKNTLSEDDKKKPE